MKFKNKLQTAYKNYSGRTPELYSRHICRLVRHYNGLAPEKMDQWHIDSFLAWMVRPAGYSVHSTNQAKQAIKVYFEYINNPMIIEMVSTRHYLSVPSILSKDEIDRLFNNLSPLYRMIATEIYKSLLPPNEILKKYPSRGATVTTQTVNKKLRRAARDAGIYKPASIQVLRNSGIVHQLKDTNDSAGVAARYGIDKAGQSYKRYLRLAGVVGRQ